MTVIQDQILATKRLQVRVDEKHDYLLKMVLTHLDSIGTFYYHESDNMYCYRITGDSTLEAELDRHYPPDRINTILWKVFKLHPLEYVTRYIVVALQLQGIQL